MNKWITLGVITIGLLLIGHFGSSYLNLHTAYYLIVVFFATQTIVLFRIDQWAPSEWQTQVALVKIVIRLITSLVFILILVYTQEDLVNMVIQVILIYLTYMIFEIVGALTNLRRN